MLSNTDLFIILILSAAGLVRGAVGFADALLAMPLLLLLLPTSVAAPLMACGSLLIAFVMLGREWRIVRWRSAAMLIIPGFVGIPVGIWLGKVVDVSAAQIGLGVVLISFSTWSLSRATLPKLTHDRHAPIFGIAAGVLGGAFNTGGPPLVFYSALRRWTPQEFRATMQAYAVTGSLSIIAMHGLAGNLTSDTGRWFLIAAPFVTLTTLFGQRLQLQTSAERFARWTHVLLIGLGVLLVSAGAI